MIIAIDGPAGAGKSTVCRLLASELGYTYLDTGAMYRAVAWALIREGIDPGREAQVSRQLHRIPLRFSIINACLVISYRDSVLEEELRLPEMSELASLVSRIPSVRDYLTLQQKELARLGSVVAEGRDMTTVVFPCAPVKVYLTATLPVRAGRRLAEYRQKGIAADYSSVEQRMRERDEADENRNLAPLRPSPDAHVLDTSELDISEVVAILKELVRTSAQRDYCAISHKN